MPRSEAGLSDEQKARKALEASVLGVLSTTVALTPPGVLELLRRPGSAPFLSRLQLYELRHYDITCVCQRLERRGLVWSDASTSGQRAWLRAEEPALEVLHYQYRALVLLRAMPAQDAVDVEGLRTPAGKKIATKRAKEVLLEHGLVESVGGRWRLTERGRWARRRFADALNGPLR